MGPDHHSGIAACITCFVALWVGIASGMTTEERARLDLSGYVVTDPDASFMNVAERMDLLRRTDNYLLRNTADELVLRTNCQRAAAIPALDFQIRLPNYYPDPDLLQELSQPLSIFEETVSDLAGAFVASGDPYYADCLVDLLFRLAESGAFENFYYAPESPQAWYVTEASLFAAALNYSLVRQVHPIASSKATVIEEWLARSARRHSNIAGRADGSCCNHRLYRRGLYSTAIGILVDDNALFQFGVSTLYSALSQMEPDGSLPLELARGDRAFHYHNYSLLYLTPIAHLIERQGYSAFDLYLDNNNIMRLYEYTISSIYDNHHNNFDQNTDNNFSFIRNERYLAWIEIYLFHFENEFLEELIMTNRPLFNRSMIGNLTLYFMDPESQFTYENENNIQ